MRPFCKKNFVHKIPRFREGGGGHFGFKGGGGPILFLWARDFSDFHSPHKSFVDALSYFGGIFFSYFRGPTRNGGFRIFFVLFSCFRDSGVFLGPVPRPQDPNPDF